MQVKTIAVNAAELAAAGRGIPAAGLPGANQAQAEAGKGFGPECKVTISREGKNFSRQQTARELAEEVKDLIEERHDADRIPKDEKEELPEEKDEQTKAPEEQENVQRALSWFITQFKTILQDGISVIIQEIPFFHTRYGCCKTKQYLRVGQQKLIRGD